MPDERDESDDMASEGKRMSCSKNGQAERKRTVRWTVRSLAAVRHVRTGRKDAVPKTTAFPSDRLVRIRGSAEFLIIDIVLSHFSSCLSSISFSG